MKLLYSSKIEGCLDHDVMNEFMSHEIKNHPTVSSEYVKFLATHTAHKELQAIKKRVDMVDKKVPELEKEIKKAGDNAKSAQSLAQTMTKELKEKK